MDRQVQKKLTDAMACPVTAFAVGALCGLTMGMLMLPWVKGVVIGSYNKTMPGKPPRHCHGHKPGHDCCHKHSTPMPEEQKD